MDNEKILKLIEKEDFIDGVKEKLAIGSAHIAVSLAKIRREGLFLAVSDSWKGYIILDRNGLGYKESIRLARIGEIYLTFQKQLEENDVKLSENMSKMDLFDSEIASKDPRFYEMFKRLSYRKLKDYIYQYSHGGYTVYPELPNGVNVTVNGASLYIDGEKAKGLNLNEISEAVHAGKRFVVIAVDDDNEARRIKRRIER